MPAKDQNLSTRHQLPGDAGRPGDTLDRGRKDRGKRAPETGSREVHGSGAPDADLGSDPPGGNRGGLKPSGEAKGRSRRHKTHATTAWRLSFPLFALSGRQGWW